MANRIKLTVFLTISVVLLVVIAGCGSSSKSTSTSSGTKTTDSATKSVKATAKKSTSGGATSTVNVTAAPNGDLMFVKKTATAKAGKVTINFTNKSTLGHDLRLEKGEDQLGGTPVITNSSASFTVNLKPGTYNYYCDVPGHEDAGMKGTLTVS